MVIDKLISVGGLCEGFAFAELLGKRVHGPVDNVAAKNFRSLINLFNGKLFNDILNDNVTKEELNMYRKYYSSDEEFLKTHDDFNLRYYDDWRSGHINFLISKRKEEIKKRIDIFNKYNDEVKSGKENLYYLYTISEFEDTLTKEDFEYTYNNLPKYVIKNLIIFGANRNSIPEIFKNKFKYIQTNFGFDNKFWN